MTALLSDYFVIVLLVLFCGVLFWAFKPKKKKNQSVAEKTSSNIED